MLIKTLNTRLLVSIVANLKKQEIENYRLKINKLNQLMVEHPDQKIHISHYRIAKSRLDMLRRASKELEHLENDMNDL